MPGDIQNYLYMGYGLKTNIFTELRSLLFFSPRLENVDIGDRGWKRPCIEELNLNDRIQPKQNNEPMLMKMCDIKARSLVILKNS